MILSRYTLKKIINDQVTLPDESVFELPEKVLQFGTGVLLRGLPAYFIDKANRNGIFNGRIVAVKSTSQGDISLFHKQDCLYTLCSNGLHDGEKVAETIINSSLSRVLSANEQWEHVLECAHNRQMQIIISNTTETGIQLVNDDIRHHPPKSFPGKLLAFLYERYKSFDASEQSGMVIIPTELIPDNGRKLESIVLELAHLNGLEDDFIEWVEKYNHFCNSLVDRIVPGKPDAEVQAGIEAKLGYSDSLLVTAEPYCLWAIEGNEHVKNILSFAEADANVVVTKDINVYRELKLRLLNGTHTLSAALAFLAGFTTVSQAMDDDAMSVFVAELMQNEIAPAIPYDVRPADAQKFARQVLDRFRNPDIRHQWINITAQYSAKIKLRCIPVLLKHYQFNKTAPELFALGFAAYIYFMRPIGKDGDKYYGELDGKTYVIQDDQAEVFYKRWASVSLASLVEEVLADTALWEEDLNTLSGFAETVTDQLKSIVSNGAKETINEKIFQRR